MTPLPAEVVAAMQRLQHRYQRALASMDATSYGEKDLQRNLVFAAQLAANELAYASGIPAPDWAVLRDEAYRRRYEATHNTGRVAPAGPPLDQERTRAVSADGVRRAIEGGPNSLAIHRLRNWWRFGGGR